MRLRQRAAEDGEVLAEHEHETAVDRAVAGDDAVAQVALSLEAEVRCAMSDERVELDERIGVEQQLESFACGELAALVLLVDALLATAKEALGAHLLETREIRFFRVHGMTEPPTRLDRSLRRYRSNAGCPQNR